MNPSIEPCLWFQADEAHVAVDRYIQIIPNSRLLTSDMFENSGPNEDASVSFFEFELAGRRIQAFGTGRHEQPNPSISLKFASPDRESVERVGRELLEGGTVLMPFDAYPWSDYYGWISDRYGITWQILVEPNGPLTVTPAMMFVREQNGHAQDAIDLYTSLFPDSGVDLLQKFGEDDAEQAGNVLFSIIHLAGQRFDLTDSGAFHQFQFNEIVSLAVMCDGQAEIDRYWDGLLAGGGEPVHCGWLKDRFGVSWQIVPRRLAELLRDSDPERRSAVMHRMVGQVKIDIAELEAT